MESLDARWKAPGLIRSFLESFVKSDHRGRYPTSTKSCTKPVIPSALATTPHYDIVRCVCVYGGGRGGRGRGGGDEVHFF